MSLETALNEAIESAEEILNFLMEEIENYGRPHHPSPSRKSLRESANFIQRVFNQEPTLPNVFMVLFRMSRRLYDRLLSFIEADLTVQSLRNVSPRDKLAIYLLFVGSGWTIQHVSAVTLYGEKTVHRHVMSVSQAIKERLGHFVKTPKSIDEWKVISEDFEKRTCLPNCLGALDGKYIYIRKPDNAGSQWYCHKMRHAMVLMALVDSKYRFLWAQVGSYGSNNDAYIFNNSDFCQKAEKGYLNLPEDRRLPDSNKMLPYFFVGDDAFALRPWLMKPLKHGDMLTKEDAEANYRISLARRCVEKRLAVCLRSFDFFKEMSKWVTKMSSKSLIPFSVSTTS